MSLWAIVPVKPLRRGKSRLSGVLSDEERYQLNVRMLGNTIDVLHNLSDLEQVMVVSRDPEALSIARERGARTVREAGQPKLNGAIRRATEAARQLKAQGVLIVPADIPQLNKEDLQDVIDQAKYPPVVVIAPDHQRGGTNALLVRPAGLLRKYAYGKDSFNKHIKLAEEAGATVHVVERKALSYDLDVPEDLPFYETSAVVMGQPRNSSVNGNHGTDGDTIRGGSDAESASQSI